MATKLADFACFHHVIQHWAKYRPDTTAFHFLPDGEQVETSLSFEDLDKKARQIAILLQQKQLTKQPVLLQFRPGIDFIVAFFGCLYAGAIAVSAYPPGSNRSKTERLNRLIESCNASVILTNKETEADVLRESADSDLSLLCVEEAQRLDSQAWRSPDLTGLDIAFLQYSSGSTGDPKGVVITHQNLMSNQKAIKEGMGNGDHTVFASWLPLFHDMGLVGNVMQPIYLGVTCWLMPPMAFLQKPIRWLQLISDARVTCTGGPDFSYELCVSRVSAEERQGLDLSCWQVAYNGAEPIRSKTLKDFYQSYSLHGLKREAIFPCYGLAEATLFVTGSGCGNGFQTLDVCSKRLSEGYAQVESNKPTLSLVSSGQLWSGADLAIVNPETGQRCADSQVGEIWLKGGSVTQGYWNAPEQNQQSLSTIVNEGHQVWMKTGDLGFLSNDQLYVTGRLKELLIVRGKNHYPQDIESTVQQAYPGLISGNGVAFLADDQLVVVQELQRSAVRRFNYQQSLQAVRKAVSDKHGLMLSHFVAVKPGRVLKTSSGKLRRRHMRELWQSGQIECLGEASSGTQQEVRQSPLVQALKARGVDALSQQTLSALGLDSLTKLELHSTMQEKLNKSIPLEWFLDDLSIEDIERELTALPVKAETKEASFSPTSLSLTPWQQAIWLHQQRDPASPCFNLVTEVPLTQPMEASQVQQRLLSVAAHHPQLKAVIQAGEWLAVPDVELTEQVTDDWNDIHRTAWLTEYRARPFDLHHQPPWRCALLCRSGKCTEVVIAVHHIALDASAGQVLVKDIHRAFNAEPFTSTSVALPQLLGELSHQEEVDDESHLALVSELLDVTEHLDFNLPKPVVPGRVASVRHRLCSADWAEIQQFATQAGVTTHALFSAGFASLLSRYSGEETISLGVPVSIRTDSQADWVNNAVNVVPMPVSFCNARTLNEVLKHVGVQTQKVLLNRFTPYTSLLEQVRNTQPGREYLFHALFSCQPDGQQVPTYIPAVASQSPLSLMIYPSKHELVLDLEYDHERFEQSDVKRLISHLTRLILAGIRNPYQPLTELVYLSEEEMSALGLLSEQSVSMNNSYTDIITCFNQQTEKQPEAIAVEDAQGAFQYQELQLLAREYLLALQQQGVKPYDRVAIALPRNRHLPAAILAVLAIGATYVPLDFDYPQDRLNTIINDSQVNLVVTHRPEQFPVTACLEPVQSHFAKPGPLPSAGLSHIAYVLYTSGSTGRPKGVQVTHTNIAALINWACDKFSMQERSRVLASTSVCFDLSVFELFVPLSCGGTCVIVNKILDLIDTRVDVSLVNTVPSAIEALLNENAFPESARVALVAGEPFHQSLVERLLNEARLPRLFDLYGPTEDTVYSTCGERRIGGTASIGRVLPCSRAYVLDANQQPVADGMGGELWLAGDKVSAGYLNRPSITEAVFRVPASIEHLEKHAYRTGDKVRRLADGRLIYLGRLDNQVKLNGYRIELNEIEQHLLDCPGIEKAVVKVATNAEGQDILVAWYIDQLDAGHSRLRRSLVTKVPSWMMPSLWLACDGFPQTPNGKTDRAALSVPDKIEQAAPTSLSERESILADLWEEVLGIRPQNSETNFVNLGGNSLLALKLGERLSKHLDREIPVALLFTHRTLGDQAEAIFEFSSAQPDIELEEMSL